MFPIYDPECQKAIGEDSFSPCAVCPRGESECDLRCGCGHRPAVPGGDCTRCFADSERAERERWAAIPEE